MAVYSCECGLIISTSAVRPRCLRCLRVLGPRDCVDGRKTPPVVTAAAGVERPRQISQVTLGNWLNERPVLSPVVRPK